MCGAHGIDIGGNDVRLDFVGGDLLGGRAVMDGIEQSEKFPRAFVLSHEREGHRGPNGAVSVLAAILAHAGDVAFDVAGIERRFVKGRIEKLNEFCIRDESGADRRRSWPDGSAAGSPAPLITDQLCGSESIWHSGFVCEPSGSPLSK